MHIKTITGVVVCIYDPQHSFQHNKGAFCCLHCTLVKKVHNVASGDDDLKTSLLLLLAAVVIWRCCVIYYAVMYVVTCWFLSVNACEICCCCVNIIYSYIFSPHAESVVVVSFQTGCIVRLAIHKSKPLAVMRASSKAKKDSDKKTSKH